VLAQKPQCRGPKHVDQFNVFTIIFSAQQLDEFILIFFPV